MNGEKKTEYQKQNIEDRIRRQNKEDRIKKTEKKKE
jgi:hypothetical protein